MNESATNEKTTAILADTILHAENDAALDKRDTKVCAAQAIYEAAGKTPKAWSIYLGVCVVANALYDSEYDTAYAAAESRHNAAR